jgi:hypothetical protein
MFASRVVSRVIYETLSSTPGVTNVVGDRIIRGLGYPQNTKRPALLFYMEYSVYEPGPVTTARAEHLTSENMRFVVRLDDVGTSDTRIAQAADAQLTALAGLRIDTPDGHQVSFEATGEVPMTTYIDGEQTYQRLGTVYSVNVTRGGY